MPTEPDLPRDTPVPGIWRLAWLTLMQPVTLRAMYQEWGLDEGPSLHKAWRREQSPVGRALFTRYAFLLFVSLLLAIALVVIAFRSSPGSSTPQEPPPVWKAALHGVTFGVACGLVVSCARSVVRGWPLGVGLSLVLSVGAGLT